MVHVHYDDERWARDTHIEPANPADQDRVYSTSLGSAGSGMRRTHIKPGEHVSDFLIWLRNTVVGIITLQPGHNPRVQFHLRRPRSLHPGDSEKAGGIKVTRPRQ